jgi:hypothetical protein
MRPNPTPDEPSVEPGSAEPKPVKRRRYRTTVPVLEMKNGRLRGLAECVLHHCVDTDKFYSIPQMIAAVDPEDQFKLTPTAFHQLTYRFDNGYMNVHVETRPVARKQKHYRFYRRGKSIGLDVLKTKFRPVIEALKIEGNRPISHQSTGRFLDAARLLIQLLRDLEAE